MCEKEDNSPDRHQLPSILNGLNDGVYIVNKDYEITYVNAAFLAEFGPVNNRKCYEYVYSRSKPCPECRLPEITAGKTVHDQWHCERTGKVYDATASPLTNPDGSVSKLKVIHGITESKQIQQQVSDLACFPDENPFPVLRLAADGTILYSNTPGMVIVEEWGGQIGKKAPENWRLTVTKTLEQNRYHVEEIRCGQKQFLVAVAPIPERGYVNLYGRDITKQKQIEDNLRASEKKYRLLIDRNPDGIFALDSSGRLIQANPACEAISGYTIKELLQKTFMQFCAPDQLERTLQHFEQILINKQYTQLETAIIQKDGRRVELWIAGEPIQSEDQGLIIYCTARDITERKQADEALRESEERFHSMFNRHQAVKLVIEPKTGAIFDANDAAAAFYGYSREKLCTMYIQDINQLPPEKIATERLAASERKSNYFVFPHRLADGTVRTVEVYSTPVNIMGRKLLYSIIHDITERKTAEEALEWNARRNKLLSDMAARLLQSDDPQKLIEDLCHLVVGFLDCDTYFNFLLDEKAGRLYLNAFTGITVDEANEIKWLDFGMAICGCVARDHERIIVENIQNTSDLHTNLIKSYGIQAYCCHPLIVGDRLIGTLSFGTRKRSSFASREIEVMKAFSDMVAFALYRIEAERSIRENEKRLRSAAKAVDFGTFEVDMINGNLYWSPEFRQIVGWPATAPTPTPYETPGFIHPDDRGKFQQMVRTVMDASSGNWIEEEYRIFRPDGSLHWIWLQGQVEVDVIEGQKKAHWATGILLDITARKTAEEKLKKSYEELSHFNRLAVDRELRMIELKKEINVLCQRADLPLRYPIDPKEGLPMIERET